MLGGDPRGAITAFDRALELDASLIEARFNRGVAHLRAGSAAEAATEFAAITGKESPAAPSLKVSAAYHRALALDRLGDAARAEAALDQALAADPAFAPAMLYAGLLRERRGKLEEAVRSYLAYLKVHPESTAAMLRVGIVAQRAGRTDVGITYLRRVVQKAPSSPEAIEARKFLVMWE